MKRPITLSLLVFLLVARSFAAQPFTVEAVEDASAEFPGAPQLHSSAFAQWNGKLVFIGGRINGYHAVGGGPADFMRAHANRDVWVVDTTAEPARTYRAALTQLPATHLAVKEQWSASAFMSTQVGDRLYIAGGYGQNEAGEWLTYPLLSVVSLPAMIDGVIKGRVPGEAVKFIKSADVQSSGGELLKMPGGDFYLVMGHVFMGSYSAFESHSENNTPAASQDYLEEIRQLKIAEVNGALSVSVVKRFKDPEFHRRDLNITEVLSEKGVGLAAFGGVFTPKTQSVFTAPVFFRPGETPKIDNDFFQRMNSYSAARLLLYDSKNQSMYVTLFGGISRYYYDFKQGAFCLFPQEGTKTTSTYFDGLQWGDQISTLAIQKDKVKSEWVHEASLPGFLGTNAVFVPLPEMVLAHEETRILDLAKLRGSRTLVGYIFGGIRAYPYTFPYNKSATPYNSGNVPSKASELILKVYVTVPEAE